MTIKKTLILTFFALSITTAPINSAAKTHDLKKIEALGRTALTEIGINPDTLASLDKKVQPKKLTPAEETKIATTILAIETSIANHITKLYALLNELNKKYTLIAQTLPLADQKYTPEQLKIARIQMGFLKYEIMKCTQLIQAFTTAANLSLEAQKTRVQQKQ